MQGRCNSYFVHVPCLLFVGSHQVSFPFSNSDTCFACFLLYQRWIISNSSDFEKNNQLKERISQCKNIRFLEGAQKHQISLSPFKKVRFVHSVLSQIFNRFLSVYSSWIISFLKRTSSTLRFRNSQLSSMDYFKTSVNDIKNNDGITQHQMERLLLT